MGKKNSSLLNSVYVPMIGCFVAGVVVSRLMNHQDVVTGDVKEGDKWTDLSTWSKDTWIDVVGVIVLIIVGFMFLGAGRWIVKTAELDRIKAAADRRFDAAFPNSDPQ